MDYELRLKAIEARLAALEAEGKQSSGSKDGELASDAEFQGRWGNPEGWADPKDWTGPSMKGTPFSQCPPEWLDMAAVMYQRFGEKAEREGKTGKDGKPVAWKDYQKARLARRWAAEIRGGNVESKGKTTADEDFDPIGDLPF